MTVRHRSRLSEAWPTADVHHGLRTPSPSPGKTLANTDSSPEHDIDTTPVEKPASRNKSTSGTVRKLSKTLRAKASAIFRTSESSPEQTAEDKGSKTALRDSFKSSMRKKRSAFFVQTVDGIDAGTAALQDLASTRSASSHDSAGHRRSSLLPLEITLDITSSPLRELRECEWYQDSVSDVSLVEDREIESQMNEGAGDKTFAVKNSSASTPVPKPDLKQSRERFYSLMWHPHNPEIKNYTRDILSAQAEADDNHENNRLRKRGVADTETEIDTESDEELILRRQRNEWRNRFYAHRKVGLGKLPNANMAMSLEGTRLLVEAIDKSAGWVPDPLEVSKVAVMVKVVGEAMRARAKTLAANESPPTEPDSTEQKEPGEHGVITKLWTQSDQENSYQSSVVSALSPVSAGNTNGEGSVTDVSSLHDSVKDRHGLAED